MPEFKDGFQNNLNTLRYCKKYQVSRTTEMTKTMVMAKEKFKITSNIVNLKLILVKMAF